MTDAPRPLPTSLTQLLDSYFAGHVLMTCTRLKVYTKCAEAPQDAATLGARCEVDPGWMSLMLDANVALGLLAETAEGYVPTELAGAYLNEQKHGALTNLVKFAAAEEAAGWEQVTDIVRGRIPRTDYDAEQQTDPRKARAFAKSTYSQLLADAKKCATFQQATTVVELGNGLAPLGLVALQQNPDAHVTVVDWPSYEVPLNKTVTHAGYRARMTFVGGDPISAAPLTAAADLVCCSGVLSRSSAERRAALLDAAARALRAGGQLHAQEYVNGPEADRTVALARLRLAMLFGPESATPLEREDVLDLLAAAGFHSVVILPIPDSPMTCITATRAE